VSNSIEETNGQRHVCLFVCLFARVSVVTVRGVHSDSKGERNAMPHRNLRGRDNNLGSTNKYTKFGQLIIRKIIKYCHLMSPFKAKMHRIRFLTSVRLFVCPNVF